MSGVFKTEMQRLVAAVANYEKARTSAAEQEAITISRQSASAMAYHAKATKPVRDAILAALQNGERLSTMDIARILGKHRVTAYSHLMRMVDLGVLSCHSMGSGQKTTWWIA